MAAYFQFQRVRIVRCPVTAANGRECTLLRREFFCYHEAPNGRFAEGWLTDLPHPHYGGQFGVLESHIEPLKFDPTADELAEMEGVDMEILAPVEIVTRGDCA